MGRILNRKKNCMTHVNPHKKKCCTEKAKELIKAKEPEKAKEPTDKELIMMLIKENAEFKNMIIKVLENGTHNTTNNNTNNTNTNCIFDPILPFIGMVMSSDLLPVFEVVGCVLELEFRRNILVITFDEDGCIFVGG